MHVATLLAAFLFAATDPQRPVEKPPNRCCTPKVADSTGKVIRKFKGPARLGINRVNWDLTRDAFKVPPRPDDEEDEVGRGPLVLQGAQEPDHADLRGRVDGGRHSRDDLATQAPRSHDDPLGAIEGDHEIAKRQMKNFSGMMTFQTKRPGPEIAARMVNELEVIHYAVSLGHHRSLIYWIGTDDIEASSFRHAPDAARRFRDLMGNGVFRLSVGIEHANDICADLSRCF